MYDPTDGCPDCGTIDTCHADDCEYLTRQARAAAEDGLLVIPVDIAAQNSFTCDCGTVTYTGDLDVQVDTDGCHGDDTADEDEAAEVAL